MRAGIDQDAMNTGSHSDAEVARRRGLSAPIVGGLIGAALGEGWLAAQMAYASDRSAGTALAAFAAAFGVLFLFGLPIAAGLSWVSRRSSSVRFARALTHSLGAGSPGLAIIGAVFAVAGSAALALTAGSYLTRSISTRFVQLATAALAALGVVVLAVLFAFAAEQVGRRARELVRDPIFAPVALLGLAVATCLYVLDYLPPMYAFAPTGAVIGMSVGTLPFVRGGSSRGFAVVVGALLALACTSLAILESFPNPAQITALYRAPTSSAVFASTWALTDLDDDGFSPILHGGDCDDGDARVNPSARDIPDNGLDEDCSGADTERYVPVEPPELPTPRPERPLSAIIIMMDALRPDHLGLAGYERGTSPNMDAFREGATWFRNAYTNTPSTRFALASLFTGYDGRRLDITALRGPNRSRLEEGAPTIARALVSRGYTAHGHTIDHVVRNNLGLGQGFARWSTPWSRSELARIYRITAQRTSDAGLAFLDRLDEDERFFLFLHYRCTHDPYHHYPEYDFGHRQVDRYDSALRYCDEHIGRVLDEIDDSDRRSDTAVFIVSDHGELFGDHGLSNHGNSVFEPDVRVLLLARIPGVVAVPTVKAPVQLSDVAPTIAALAHTSLSEDLDGWNLLHHYTGSPVPPDRRPLFMFTQIVRAGVAYDDHAVLHWPYKLIRNTRTGLQALYDVAADPEERRDLTEDRPAEVDRLRGLLDAYDSYATAPNNRAAQRRARAAVP